LVLEDPPEDELKQIRAAIGTNKPFGHVRWCCEAAAELGLGVPDRPRGRPRKVAAEKSTRPLFYK
jgi:hypothetical protein